MSSSGGQGPVTHSPVPLSTVWARNVFILAIAMPVLATITVFLRFYCRRMKQTRPDLSDWLLVPALIFYYFQCLIDILGVVLGGTGHHIEGLAPQVLVDQSKLLIAVQVAYPLALAFVKASVCTLLIKIFGVNRPFKITVWITIIMVICWAILTILASFLNCSPFNYNWNKRIDGHCDNFDAIFSAIAGIDIVIDLVILILPMPMVWRLQMPLRIKLALMASFGLGFVDVVMGILRVTSAVSINWEGDFTRQGAPLWFWTGFEPGLAIIVACTIVMRPILEKMIPEKFITHYEKSKGAYGYGGYGSANSHSQGTSASRRSEAPFNLEPGTTTSAASNPLKDIDSIESSEDSLTMDEMLYGRRHPHHEHRRSLDPTSVHVQRDVTVVREDGVPPEETQYQNPF